MEEIIWGGRKNMYGRTKTVLCGEQPSPGPLFGNVSYLNDIFSPLRLLAPH